MRALRLLRATGGRRTVRQVAALGGLPLLLLLLGAGSAYAAGPLDGLTSVVSDTTGAATDGVVGVVESVDPTDADAAAVEAEGEATTDEAAADSGKVLGIVEELTDPLAEPVTDVVEDVAEPLGEPVERIAAPVVEPVLEQVDAVTDPIVEPLKAVAKPVVEKIESLGEPVLEDVDAIAEPVLAKIDTVVEPVLVPLKALAALALDPVDDVLNPPLFLNPPPVVMPPTVAVPPPVDTGLPPLGPGLTPPLAGDGAIDDGMAIANDPRTTSSDERPPTSTGPTTDRPAARHPVASRAGVPGPVSIFSTFPGGIAGAIATGFGAMVAFGWIAQILSLAPPRWAGHLLRAELIGWRPLHFVEPLKPPG